MLKAPSYLAINEMNLTKTAQTGQGNPADNIGDLVAKSTKLAQDFGSVKDVAAASIKQLTEALSKLQAVMNDAQALIGNVQQLQSQLSSAATTVQQSPVR